MHQSILGLPWFPSKHDFEQLRLLLVDGENITANYEEWFARAKSFEAARESQGVRIVRAEMKFPEFIEWCRGKNLKTNARSRTLFADECVAKVREAERFQRLEAVDRLAPF